jgi:hypothetical protein
MFSKSSSPRRRSAFRPALEAVERRELLSISNFSPVGMSTLPGVVGQPVLIEFQIQKTGKTPLEISAYLISEGTKSSGQIGRVRSERDFSSDHYVNLTIKTKVKLQESGVAKISVKIDGKWYEYQQTYLPDFLEFPQAEKRAARS